MVMPASDFALEYGNADARKFARSRDELAQILGCATITVARMLKERGNPGRNANGTYVVEDWREYYEERKDAADTSISLSDEDRARLGAARIRREEARASIEELRLERERGTLLDAREVEAAWSDAYEAVKKIFRAELVEKEPDPEMREGLEERFGDALVKIARFFKEEALKKSS